MKPNRLLPYVGVAAAFVLGASVGRRYAHDMRAARDRYGALPRVAATRVGHVEYASVGEGTPLLIVHGAGGGYDQSLDLGTAFVERGFRVIAPSRFGYLGTPLPDDASVEAQADAHAALLDWLGLPRAMIIGASAGAPSAMQFALRYPQRCEALVLLVPAGYVPRPGRAPALLTPAITRFLFDTALRFDFLMWAAMKLAPRALVRGLLATPPAIVSNASGEEQARVGQLIEHILPVSVRRRGLINDADITSSLPRYDLKRITAPTLVASVGDDLFGTLDVARYTAEHIPGARLLALASGGHVWVGHHAQLIGEIDAFLRAHASAAS